MILKHALMTVICGAVLGFTGAALAQTNSPASKTCPRIELNCPKDQMLDGTPWKATASIIGADPNTPLKYEWFASAGTITEGQNSAAITLDSTGLAFDCLLVKLRVEGLPAGCSADAKCKYRFSGIADPRKFDEFGNISLKEEKLRLDNIAFQLKAEPTMLLRIAGANGNESHRRIAMKRIKRVVDYLTNNRSIARERILVGPHWFRSSSVSKLRLEFTFEPPPEFFDRPCPEDP